MEKYLKKLELSENLTLQESIDAFEILMNGKANDNEIYNFLTLLSKKGEVSTEIAGGVSVLRNKAKKVNVDDCIDTCGTGGDGKDTLNISTASALLLSSMSINVAKHGNKAVSSKCGSADVLEALNININLEPKDIENQIKKNHFGFMFAPNYHSVEKQVVGVFDKKLLDIFANALKDLNIKFAWIVNSNDGLDEISPYDKTIVKQLRNGEINEMIIDPKELKVNAEGFDKIVGNDAKYNSQKIIDIFKGNDDDFSKAVSLNAAAGLIISEREDNFKYAYEKARDHLLSGKTYSHLEKLRNV